tara:strand:+ start:2848 stop:4935 length:2088 start_codon:yes stop_codon:yes gene_type:complete
MTQKLNYRNEIDGIRAVSIIAVLINHINPQMLPSGFIGVDIFFVISGFLITSSIFSKSSGNFSKFFLNFLEKRVKRLFPALVFYVLVVSLILILFNPHPAVSIRTGLTSLLGFSNLYLYKYSTDYFAESTYLNPFVNTWSLGIEEQFYILFPFILLLSGFFKRNLKSLKNSLLTISLASLFSLLLFFYFFERNNSFAYFLPITRFWEIGLGCITFLLYKGNKIISLGLSHKKDTIISTFLFIITIFSFTLDRKYAVYNIFLNTVITSVLLIQIDNKESFLRNLLSNKCLTHIGKLSYSIYLWHWGIISLSYWIIGNEKNNFLLILIIYLVSLISYRFIEVPFRYSSWKLFKLNTFKLFILSISFVISFLLKIEQSKFLRYKLLARVTNNYIDPDSAVISQSIPSTSINRKNCHSDSFKNDYLFEEVIERCSHDFTYKNNEIYKSRTIFLAGDSHSYQLRILFSKIAKKYSSSFSSISGGFFPANSFRYTKKGKSFESSITKNLSNDYLEFILKNSNPKDLIVIANRLQNSYANPLTKKSNETYQENIFFEDNKKISRDKAMNLWFMKLEEIVKKAKNKEINILYIMPFPEFKMSAKSCLYSVARDNCSKSSKEILLKNYYYLNKNLISLSTKYKNFELIDPFKDLCDEFFCFMKGIAYDKTKEVFYYVDDNHLSTEGSMMLYEQITNKMDDLYLN